MNNYRKSGAFHQSDESLKVLFVLLTPLPYPGAAWNRIEFFARYLRSLNIKTNIAGAFSLKTVDQAGSTNLDGITINNLVPIIMTTNLLSHIFNTVSSFVAGFIVFLLIRPTVVVVSVPASGNTLGFYFFARLFRCIIITDYRDEWEDFLLNLPNSRVSKIFMKMVKDSMTKCYRKSDVVLAVTEPFVDSLKLRGIRGAIIVPNGADLEVFRPKDKILSRRNMTLPETDFIVVFSGHIGGYYRLDIVLEALEQVIHCHGLNARLIIAGRGYAVQSILNLAEELGIRDKVYYLGKIMNKEKLVEAICSADTGIVPYDSNPLWKNSLPVKSLEYLACGIPIIATAYEDSLIGRMVNVNGLGIVTKSESVESLAQAIVRMHDDTQFRIAAGKRGHTIVEKDYNRHHIGSEFSRIVIDCVDAKKNRKNADY
jgi:glycosyltransferase involved in cell wall biosynthesis